MMRRPFCHTQMKFSSLSKRLDLESNLTTDNTTQVINSTTGSKEVSLLDLKLVKETLQLEKLDAARETTEKNNKSRRTT
jgi:tetrahydromethanopterin S-methyltransferase subunit B